MLSSVSSVSSITTMLAIGVTSASVLLCFVFIGLTGAKELSVAYDDIGDDVKASLNAAIVPIMFAFVALVAVSVL